MRKIDDLGRICIPKEIRRTHNIEEGDPLEVFVSEAGVILRKYAPGCIFCGEADGVEIFKGKRVCPECAKGVGKVG